MSELLVIISVIRALALLGCLVLLVWYLSREAERDRVLMASMAKKFKEEARREKEYMDQ